MPSPMVITARHLAKRAMWHSVNLCSLEQRLEVPARFQQTIWNFSVLVASTLAIGRGLIPTVTNKEIPMIKTEQLSANALRIIAPEKLNADDFRQISPQVDSLISQYGKIRLLIDASGFNGWENIEAFENHAGFVKNHQQKVERIAVIVGHEWHHWLVGLIRMFVHPEVRAYEKSHESEALQWLTE